MKRRPPPKNKRYVRSNGKNMRGKVVSKAGETVQYESHLERSLILRLDRQREVKELVSQPLQFEWIDENGKKHTYVPDFKATHTNDAVTIYEVTTSKRRTKEEIIQREKAGRALCKERGWTYVVWTEENLPQRAERANLLLLFRYRPTCYFKQEIADAILEHLADGIYREFSNVVAELQQKGFAKPDIHQTLFHLLWHGQVQFKWDRLLLDDGSVARKTMIWIDKAV